SSASSPGFNGSAGSSFVGSTTPTISSALSNLPASLSSSNNFEIVLVISTDPKVRVLSALHRRATQNPALTERPRGLEVDRQFVPGRLLHRKIGGLGTLENLIDVAGDDMSPLHEARGV